MKNVFLMLISGAVILCDPAFANDFIRVSTMDVPPWGFVDENGEPTGVFSDIASEIAKQADISHKNRVVPYLRMIKHLEAGDADVIMLYPNEALKKIAIPIAPLFTVKNIVIGLKDTNYQSIKDLHGKTVGHVRGANYDDKLTSDDSVTKYETNNYEQNFRMLFAKHLDAIAGPCDSLFFTAKKMGYEKEQLGEPLILNIKTPWAFYSKKTANSQIISKLENAIGRLGKECAFDKIINHHLGEFRK